MSSETNLTKDEQDLRQAGSEGNLGPLGQRQVGHIVDRLDAELSELKSKLPKTAVQAEREELERLRRFVNVVASSKLPTEMVESELDFPKDETVEHCYDHVVKRARQALKGE